MLHREAKAYLDSVRAVALGQERVAAGMASLFDEGSPAARQARMYKDITELLATHGRHDFDEAFRAAVIDPITRYGILFPECEELSKRRAAKLLDYDAARSKLESEEERTREAYEEIHEILLSGIPQLIDLRVPYLNPSLVALLALQSKWAEDVNRQIEAINVSETSGRAVDDALFELGKLPVLNM